MSVASPAPVVPANLTTYRAASGSMSRSPKRAKSSPSPREGPLRSSQSATNSGRSRSRASVPNRRLEQGSCGSLQSQDPLSEARHPVTSPARRPEQSKTPWSPAQSRRREMSVPLLSQTLSSFSLSQLSPPDMSVSHTSRSNPQYTPQSASLTRSGSSSVDLSTFTPRRPARFLASGASSPGSASKRHVHPATAPLPHISAFLGSPFSSRTARGDYLYDACSPSNNRFRLTFSERIPHGEQGIPSHEELWPETSEWVDDVGPDHAAQARTHRRRDMSGSSSSIESYTNSGASSSSLPSLGRNSMEQSARPGIVTIREMYGEEEEYANEDEASTPCRTLFSDVSEGRAVSTTSVTAVDALTSPLPPKRVSSKSPVAQSVSPLQSFFSSRTPSSGTTREKTSPSSRPRSPFASLIPRLLSSRKSKTPPVASYAQLCDDDSDRAHNLENAVGRKSTSQPGAAEAAPMIGLGIDSAPQLRGVTSPLQSRTPATFMLRTLSGDSSSDPEPSPSRPLSARTSVTKLNLHSPTSPGLQRGIVSLNRRKTMIGRVQGRKSPSKVVEAQNNIMRPSLRRGITEPRPALSRSTSSVRHLFPSSAHTPPALFDHVKPSPAAFASTGLVKKRSGIAPIEIPTFRPEPQRSTARIPLQTDISPISPLSPTRPSRPGQLPRSTLNLSSQAPSSKSTTACASASGESALQAAQRTRGLRRKGSQMFGHHSSSSIGDVSRLDLSTSPATPTKGFPSKPSVSEIVATPSPGSNGHFQYPFTVSKTNKNLSTPSPEKPSLHDQTDAIAQDRISQLRRVPVARASNPMLAATFKADLLATPPESTSALTFKLNGKEVTLPQADKFNKDYIVLQLLGSGAFSQVWKVRHKREGTLWAIKAGKPYTGMKNRLRQLEEVSILRQLSLEPHPSIIRFEDSWEQHSRLYLRTELAASGDLARFLEALGDYGGLGEARAWKTLVELSGGLAHIHANNFLHLDLKPSNVLIASDGSLRIADFGMSVISGVDGHVEALSPALPTPDGDGGFVWSEHSAKTMDLVPSPILDRDIEGDREYLSPEGLADAPMGREADIYSLGILLLEAALNVVLPPNGDGWVKLRTDDFSDLSEHYRPAENSVEPAEIAEGDAGLPVISTVFLELVKGMMASDPMRRTTLAIIEGHRAVMKVHSLVREGAGDGRKGHKALVEEEAWFLPRVLGAEVNTDVSDI